MLMNGKSCLIPLLMFCGNVTQWPLEAVPPCLNICTVMLGDILAISCCSMTVRPINSLGKDLGSILFSADNILI